MTREHEGQNLREDLTSAAPVFLFLGFAQAVAVGVPLIGGQVAALFSSKGLLGWCVRWHCILEHCTVLLPPKAPLQTHLHPHLVDLALPGCYQVQAHQEAKVDPTQPSVWHCKEPR